MHSLGPFLIVIGRSWPLLSTWDSILTCNNELETVTSFLASGLDSWTCTDFGTIVFFLEYTLPNLTFSMT